MKGKRMMGGFLDPIARVWGSGGVSAYSLPSKMSDSEKKEGEGRTIRRLPAGKRIDLYE